MVQDGDEVLPGDILAKIPRETTKTKDITAVCRAWSNSSKTRKPRDPAVIGEIDGVVRYGEISKGLRKIYVESEDGKTTKEYSIPRGVHINVQEGEHVKAGEALIDGPLNLHDLLAVLGEKFTQAYLVNAIQEVYRLQGVNINDKHIETIVRQMMRWVKVEDVGDTTFLLEEQVDKFRFREENDRVISEGGRPATGRPLPPRHHQGVALDRLVHLRSQLPGNDPRPHRSGRRWQGGLSARLEGERHHGPLDSGRNGLGALPQPTVADGNAATRACGRTAA
jgi:DNA-directed RNA polymerase subunit beta'